MNELISWLVTSSSDPKKYSMAVVGMITLGVSYILPVLPVVCSFISMLCFDTSGIQDGINAVGHIVEGTLWLVGGGLTLVGFVRKLVNGRWAAPQA